MHALARRIIDGDYVAKPFRVCGGRLSWIHPIVPWSCRNLPIDGHLAVAGAAALRVPDPGRIERRSTATTCGGQIAGRAARASAASEVAATSFRHEELLSYCFVYSYSRQISASPSFNPTS